MFVVFTDAATMSVAGSARVLRGLKLSGSMALTLGLGFRVLGFRDRVHGSYFGFRV